MWAQDQQSEHGSDSGVPRLPLGKQVSLLRIHVAGVTVTLVLLRGTEDWKLVEVQRAWPALQGMGCGPSTPGRIVSGSPVAPPQGGLWKHCPALGGPKLHLRHLVAVVVPFPRTPVDAVCKAPVRAPEVAAVQVGHVTALVPPGSLVQHCTI